MPSFFEGLKRIAQGKPVFEEPPITEENQTQATSRQSYEARRAPKVFIERTETDIDDARMRTYADIRNDSDETIVLDNIRLLGTTKEIDETLRPNDRKEVLIYSGMAPTSNGMHDAELQYKDSDGNYYKARHDVRFMSQGTHYTIEKMPYENTSRI